MTTEPAAVTVAEAQPECWCCGQPYAESQLVRLGSHPEAAVCPRCAAYLHRQARARQDAQRPTPAARVRTAELRVRGYVVDRGWHRNRYVGPWLRWLGDHLP
jgi:hypothetical protein